MSKRITVEMVREAYLATGLKPRRGRSAVIGGACCGLGAMAVQRGRPPGSDAILEVLCDEWDREYLTAFIAGFDEWGEFAEQEVRRNIGYADGQSAAHAVFGGTK